MNALVNDILDAASLRHQELQLQRHAVDIKALADVVLQLSLPLLRDKPLQLINALDADLPPVLADENRLQQILHNLIGNAIKFSEHGCITISAETQAEQVWISIADTSMGIAADVRLRSLSPFARAVSGQ